MATNVTATVRIRVPVGEELPEATLARISDMIDELNKLDGVEAWIEAATVSSAP